MGDFGSGFATGFFNKLSEGIDTRNKDARDYFNAQVETARQLGLDNKRRSSAAMDESVSIAKRLQAMGVPKDIIMAQANMDPAGLGDFYTQVEKLRLDANVPVDENFFRSIYKLSGTFKAPDEDFTTFFSRIYGPVVDAAHKDPEGFKQDPEGSIWASAFGINAMDKARKRLATTEVVPGMTAEEAIARGDQVQTNKVGGDSFVVADPEALRKVTSSNNDNPTLQEMNVLNSSFDDLVTTTKTELTSSGAYDTTDPEQLDILDQASKKAAYEKSKELYAGEDKYLSYLRKRYNLTEDGDPLPSEAPQEGSTATEAPVEGDSSPEQTTAPTAAPKVPVVTGDPVEQNPSVPNIEVTSKDGEKIVLQFVKNNLDGTLTYKNQNTGELLTYPVEQFNELMRRQ